MEIKENYNTKLETERLVLTPWELAFVPKMFTNWASDEIVTRYLPWDRHKNQEETKQIVLQWMGEANYNWCILNKQNNEPIGSINVVKRNDSNFNCEVGYCLSRKNWNKGYMTEALKKVVEFLFDEGFYKVELKHVIENGASGRVMQKAGLIFQGINPASCYIRGTFYDCNVYYILNPKIKNKKTK